MFCWQFFNEVKNLNFGALKEFVTKITKNCCVKNQHLAGSNEKASPQELTYILCVILQNALAYFKGKLPGIGWTTETNFSECFGSDVKFSNFLPPHCETTCRLPEWTSAEEEKKKIAARAIGHIRPKTKLSREKKIIKIKTFPILILTWSRAFLVLFTSTLVQYLQAKPSGAALLALVTNIRLGY